MQFTISDQASSKSQCVVVGLHDNRQWPAHTKFLGKECFRHIDTMLKTRDIQISGKLKQAELLHACPGIAEKNVLIIGLGKMDDFSEKNYKKVLNHMIDALNERGILAASTYLQELKIKGRSSAWNLKQFVLNVSNKTYAYNDNKVATKDDSPKLDLLHLKNSGLMSLSVAHSVLAQAIINAESITIARDLGNAPPNICNPSYLADYIKKAAKSHAKLSTRSLGDAALKKLGMNCLLAVGSGSDNESKLITIEYKGGIAKDKPIVLVGKGITFDTGGLNLKTFAGMSAMKMDMCGAASVIASLFAAAKLKLPINVVGVIASAENKTGAKAYRPSDILTSMSGQTVEVLNTDAEGRLVLCDALTYCKKFDPKVVIDIATLTGAIVVSLGHYYTGLFCKNEKLTQSLLSAGIESADELWHMPLNEAHDEAINSKVADITNLNANKSSAAASSAAAAFLGRFTNDYCWAHLDIAGTAISHDGTPTGRVVSMLVEYLTNHAGAKV